MIIAIMKIKIPDKTMMECTGHKNPAIRMVDIVVRCTLHTKFWESKQMTTENRPDPCTHPHKICANDKRKIITSLLNENEDEKKFDQAKRLKRWFLYVTVHIFIFTSQKDFFFHDQKKKEHCIADKKNFIEIVWCNFSPEFCSSAGFRTHCNRIQILAFVHF